MMGKTIRKAENALQFARGSLFRLSISSTVESVIPSVSFSLLFLLVASLPPALSPPPPMLTLSRERTQVSFEKNVHFVHSTHAFFVAFQRRYLSYL